MARGMNWGIFSLLGVIVLVLVGIAAFFVHLAKRSAALASEPDLGLGRASLAASPDLEGSPEDPEFGGRFALPEGAGPLLESTDLGI
jgi:hypothetical protein